MIRTYPKIENLEDATFKTMNLAHYGRQASCLLIINEGWQPKDLVTFLLMESVNLTSDHLSILSFHPVGRHDRGPLSGRPPESEQSRAIRHLANGRQGGAANSFQRQDLAPRLRSLRFLRSQTNSGWRDVGGCPTPAALSHSRET